MSEILPCPHRWVKARSARQIRGMQNADSSEETFSDYIGMTYFGRRLITEKPTTTTQRRAGSVSNYQRLAELLDKHGPALQLFARQWCSSAADVLQDALLQLIRQPAWPVNDVAWLYRVVRNGAISASRRENRRRRHESAAAEAWFEECSGLSAHDIDNTVDAALAAERLGRLPVEQREVIVAHLWGGLSFEQIGELVGLSSSSAHRRYQSGLQVLRESMGISCATSKNPPRN